MEMNAPQQLHDAGQSIWLDNIRKGLITEGTLARYIDELFDTGVTSNPTILEKAISSGDEYDGTIRSHLSTGVTDPETLVFELASEDLVAAADLLRPTFDATGGGDGYVSVEVSPDLAHDAMGTVAAGEALFAEAGRPNVMIKVPGTAAGFVAVEELIAKGIPVNVTLLFSPGHYLGAADAYQRGLERRFASGQPAGIGSVASVFVSRWDAAADPRIPAEHRSKLGIAVVQSVYSVYRDLLGTDRWKALDVSGAMPQRVLFASTSTKDPSLPDTYYLGRLAAPGTVDTVPEPTLLAFADHGSVCDLLAQDYGGAEAVIAGIAEHGVDVELLAADLQAKGAAAFSESWASLLAEMGSKAAVLAVA
jgi:transaldolase